MSGLLFPIHSAGVASTIAWRPYQIECVNAVKDALSETSQGCLAVLPCGTGKTEIIVRLILTLVSAMHRAVVISPLQTLVGQTAARLRVRGVPCGIEQGGLRSSERITVASYKSLISRDRYQQFLEGCRLVVVDESHLNYSKRAMDILSAFRESGAAVVGLTASPDRMKGDPLTEFYGKVAFFYELQRAIADGWLVPPKVWLTVAGELDLSKFDDGDGDFSAERLAKEMSREANVQTVANLVLQHHEGEPSVVFCQGIMQAEKVREVLYRGGLEAAIVHSRMDDDERAYHLGLFESGKLSVILNVSTLMVGWDSPIVRKIFCCKPTKSRAVYQQAIGRGTRTFPPGVIDHWATPEQRRRAIAESPKPEFEVFDLVDASRHNDLITAVEALYPQADDGLARRVRKKRPAGTPQTITDLDRLIALERSLMEDEASQAASERLAREALTARQRAAWLAGVEFTTCERDAFLPAEQRQRARGWRVLWGRYKGRLLREVDEGWLHWALKQDSVTGQYRAAIAREVERRRAG